EAGASPPQVTLQLRGRPGIRGRVLFDPEDGFLEPEVRVLRIRPNDPPDLVKLAEEPTESTFSRGKESAFAFSDLVPGTYLLGVSRGKGIGPILASEVVQVVDQVVERDLNLPRLQGSE